MSGFIRTLPASSRRRRIAMALLWVISLASCDSTDASDKNTNWLGACLRSAECKEGLACRYGMCTRVCDADAECTDLSSFAACRPPSIVSTCAADTGGAARICTLPCMNNGGCARADGLVCAAGACIQQACATDASAPPPDSSVPAADAGTGRTPDASTDGASGSRPDAGARGREAGAPSVNPVDASRPPGAGVDAEAGRPPLGFADADLVLPGLIFALEYDPKRGVLYAVMQEPSGLANRLVRFRAAPEGWTYDVLDLAGVRYFTLRPDLSELLVTVDGCAVVRVDPDTFRAGASTPLPEEPCRFNVSLIFAFAGGHVLYVDHSYKYWEYPSHLEVDAPRLGSAVTRRSSDGTRLILAESSGSSGGIARAIYSYSAETRAFTRFRPLASDVYEPWGLAVSAAGKRFLHHGDVYDDTFRYLGTLDSIPYQMSAGVSGNGEVAVVHEFGGGALRVHDIRPQVGPFAAVGAPIPFIDPELGHAETIVVDETGTVAFIATRRNLAGSGPNYEYALKVRKLPALPR